MAYSSKKCEPLVRTYFAKGYSVVETMEYGSDG